MTQWVPQETEDLLHADEDDYEDKEMNEDMEWSDDELSDDSDWDVWDDGQDLEFMMELCNDLKVQQMTWREFIVPRGPKFKENITSWVTRSVL